MKEILAGESVRAIPEKNYWQKPEGTAQEQNPHCNAPLTSEWLRVEFRAGEF